MPYFDKKPVVCLQSDIKEKRKNCELYLFSDNITTSITGDIELKLGDYFRPKDPDSITFDLSYNLSQSDAQKSNFWTYN